MIDHEKINIEMFSRAETIERYKKDKKVRRNEQWIFDNYFTQPGGRVLVLGCGAGRTVVPLIEKGLRVDGLDISEGMLRACQSNLDGRGMKARLIHADASELSFSDACVYDYVLFPFHGIDFVYPESKRDLVFKEAHRVLKNGGLFVYTTHNLMYWKYMLRLFLQRKRGLYVEEKIPYGSEALITYYALLPREMNRLKRYFAKVQFIGDRFAEKNKKWRAAQTLLLGFKIKYLFFIAKKA